MKRRDIQAQDAPAPASSYTQAIEVTGATRTLYVSGQVGVTKDGKTPEGIAEQSRLAYRNLEAQLKAAGMTLDNLVKVTTILPSLDDLPAHRAARVEVLGDRRPTSTLIVGGLANPMWKVEVEGIAVA
jgi:enamine deaminase RidA (YjgF/YER057c/UK114 family)